MVNHDFPMQNTCCAYFLKPVMQLSPILLVLLAAAVVAAPVCPRFWSSDVFY